MPHHWGPTGRYIVEACSHFRRKTLKKQVGQSTTFPFHTPAGKDLSSRKIPKLIGKAARYAGSAKPKKGMQYYIPTITNYTKLWWVPNVVVGRLTKKNELKLFICLLVQLFATFICSIMSRLAVGGNVGERTVVNGSIEALLGSGNLRRSRPRTALQRLHLSSRSLSTYFAQARDTSSLEIATPILIPRDDGHKHRRGSHGDVIFLTNRGEVTSYTPDVHGREPLWQWQLQTEATWSNNLPSPFSLRIHDNQPMVIKRQSSYLQEEAYWPPSSYRHNRLMHLSLMTSPTTD